MMAKPSALCRYLLIQFVRPRESVQDYARSCLQRRLWSDGGADLNVLDTSSIFAFTDLEDGADEVERLLDAAKQHECRLEVCAMSLMELYYITLRERGENLSHYQSLDPNMDRGNCQKCVKAGGNALPADHQATILLLEPSKGPL